MCYLGVEQHSSEDGQQDAQAHTEHESPGEDAPCLTDIVLPQGIRHEHATTGIDEQLEGEDKLVDGL